MAIVAYVGLPRSGKSYSVVELQILPALKAGRTVVTNIPLIVAEWDKLRAAGEITGRLITFDNNEIKATPERILEYAIAGAVLVWDELQLVLPQGLTADKVPDCFKQLFSMHGHMVDAAGNSMQIVFVTQDLGNVAKFARGLVENTFVTTKLSFVGLGKTFRVDVYHGMVTGCTPNPKKALRQLGGRYRPDIYKLYKSHTLSESSTLGANETKLDSRANIFRRPVFIAGIVGCPVLIWWSLHVFASNFHGFAMKSQARAVTDNATPALDARAQRSGARVSAPAVVAPAPSSSAAPLPSARVLLVVVDEQTPNFVTAYISVGERVEEVQGEGECRVGRHSQCLWRGMWVDEVGPVDQQVSGPVGAWSLGAPGGAPVADSGARGSRGPG
jgi:zona occludens toxin